MRTSVGDASAQLLVCRTGRLAVADPPRPGTDSSSKRSGNRGASWPADVIRENESLPHHYETRTWGRTKGHPHDSGAPASDALRARVGYWPRRFIGGLGQSHSGAQTRMESMAG